MDGCRIGFDAGGSDRKVSAVIDGECVYSEEVVWHPKTQADPQYQFEGILDSFRTAASKMPRVDGIGVSSAGVFIGNAPMISSLFIKVPRSRWDEVKTIYDRAAAEIGNVPVVVANDGDVTALAGAMGMDCGSIMGIAMGTSEAVGYVDSEGRITGWLNELAFVPVDAAPDAMIDEWSGDIGCGVKYLVTQKIFWSYNKGEQFPYHYFTWQGMDGSKIDSFLPTKYEYPTHPIEINGVWKNCG